MALYDYRQGHKQPIYCAVILVLRHEKKATKSSFHPQVTQHSAPQGAGKVNGFLTKPISPLWAEVADRWHQFPDTLPFSFKHTHTYMQ